MEENEFGNRNKIKIIKNTKGYNYELTLLQAENQSYDDWLKDIYLIEERLKQKYGGEDGKE